MELYLYSVYVAALDDCYATLATDDQKCLRERSEIKGRCSSRASCRTKKRTAVWNSEWLNDHTTHENSGGPRHILVLLPNKDARGRETPFYCMRSWSYSTNEATAGLVTLKSACVQTKRQLIYSLVQCILETAAINCMHSEGSFYPSWLR